MSEQNAEDVFDDVIDGELVDDVVSDDHKPEQQEEKPAPRGYMSKEAWVEAGKDPEDWVSPEVFKERGERIKMKVEMQRDFDNRLKNMKLFQQKQLELQRQELLSKRDDAIDTADKDTVKRLDKELKELDQYEELNKEQPAVVKPPEVQQWEEENPWCNDPTDPKLPLAQRTYKAAVSSGMSPQEALEVVDIAIAKKFIVKKKSTGQIAESSRQSAGREDTGKPTIATLTAEEKKIWESGIFDDQKDFLKAVADTRKGAKK